MALGIKRRIHRMTHEHYDANVEAGCVIVNAHICWKRAVGGGRINNIILQTARHTSNGRHVEELYTLGMELKDGRLVPTRPYRSLPNWRNAIEQRFTQVAEEVNALDTGIQTPYGATIIVNQGGINKVVTALERAIDSLVLNESGINVMWRFIDQQDDEVPYINEEVVEALNKIGVGLDL